MDRRSFLRAFTAAPLAVTVLGSQTPAQEYRFEKPLGGIDTIWAACQMLTPQLFRAALDHFGEDTEAWGHAAQRSAWQQGRIFLANPGYSHEFNEQSCDFFFGKEVRVDNSMPMDRIEFRRNHSVVGSIMCLAIPMPYVKR